MATIPPRADRSGPGDTTLADVFPGCEPGEGLRPGSAPLTPLARWNSVGVFTDADHGREALVSLERRGWEEDSLSFLAVGSTDRSTRRDADRRFSRHVVRALVPGAIGGAVVGVLVGLALVALFDWSDLAAGVLVGTVYVGAVLGAIARHWWHMGAGDRWVETFEAEGGQVVVGAHGDDPVAVREAVQILRDAGAATVVDVDARGRVAKAA